jgi:hypothetical protein
METVISGARAPSAWRVALALLSRQVIHLNLMGCAIGPSCYWAYAIRFWALPQFTWQTGLYELLLE